MIQTIYVIIVNYKTENMVEDAIRSFEEEEIDIHIVVLDNSSTESSYKVLQKMTNDRVEIIRSDRNLGFSGGVNYVAEYIKNKYKNFEYLFLFNPDAVSLSKIYKHQFYNLSSNDNIAAVSPHILTMDNKSWFSGGMIDWERCKILNNPEVVNPNEVRKVDIFNGCAVLLNAKKFFEAGMLKIDLFMYYDEAYLSMNFLERGYQCFYHPDLTAYHHVSYDISSVSTRETYYMTRNHVSFFKKYNKKKIFFCPYIDLFKTLLSHVNHFKISNLYYLLLAVYDAIRGKKGIL